VPDSTNNSAADNQKLSKTERFSRTEQSYVGRTDIKVNTTDTHLDLLIASWITTYFVYKSCRSTAVLTANSNNQAPSRKCGIWSGDITPYIAGLLKLWVILGSRNKLAWQTRYKSFFVIFTRKSKVGLQWIYFYCIFEGNYSAFHAVSFY